MGTIIELSHKIKNMDDDSLLERFNHLTRAQAIKEYLATEPEKKLDVEIYLAREEILKRMADREPMVHVHFTEDHA